jgi:hypothetical protein
MTEPPTTKTLKLTTDFAKLNARCVLLGIGLTYSVKADLIAYEPFDYPVDLINEETGDLDGQDGGVGFVGPWEDLTTGSNNGEGYIYASVGNTTETNGEKPDWDGVVDNLPQAGGYVGLSPFVSDQLEDRNNSRRLLAQSAGAMAGADGVLWMSMAVHFEDSRFNFSPGLMFTDGGGFSERVRDITDSSTGIGIGHGSAWGIDLNAITFNAGAFDSRTNVSNISTTFDNVVILKFEFGDGEDKVSTWFFTEDQEMTETDFDAKALGTTSTLNIDEDTLTTLAVGFTRAGNAFDEIRIGDTFGDIISAGSSVGGPAELEISAINYSPLTSEVTLTWSSRPGVIYAVHYSGDLVDWTNDLDDGVTGQEGESTTMSFNLDDAGVVDATKLFFRIEKD